VTTLEPGESVVLTQGLALRPARAALRASSAAPSITEGLEVFVQLVMAAIRTAPSFTSYPAPPVTVPEPVAPGFFLARSSDIWPRVLR